MMRDIIRGLINAFPFTPFGIEVASGRIYRVEHPDFLLLENDTPEVWVEESTGQTHILNPMLITAIQQDAKPLAETIS